VFESRSRLTFPACIVDLTACALDARADAPYAGQADERERMTSRLSARQEECLRLTAFLTDKEIAARLGLSEATVKKHVHEACRRLGV